MGGRIALHAALALPGRVDRLVLIGASPGIADPAEREARRPPTSGSPTRSSARRIEEFAARWAQTPVLAGQPPDVAAAVHADRLRNTPAGLARALRGLGTGALPSLWERLAELEMPVVLMVGERDREVHARSRARWRAGLPARRSSSSRVPATPSTWRRRPRWRQRDRRGLGGLEDDRRSRPALQTSSTRRVAEACSHRPLSTSARHRASTSSSASRASTSVVRSVLKTRLSAA